MKSLAARAALVAASGLGISALPSHADLFNSPPSPGQGRKARSGRKNYPMVEINELPVRDSYPSRQTYRVALKIWKEHQT